VQQEYNEKQLDQVNKEIGEASVIGIATPLDDFVCRIKVDQW
ncbi:unnamed protein product, partial [Adineta steineri]